MKEKHEIPFSLTFYGMVHRLYITPENKLCDNDNLMFEIITTKDFTNLKIYKLRDMKDLIEKNEFKDNLEMSLKQIESALKKKKDAY